MGEFLSINILSFQVAHGVCYVILSKAHLFFVCSLNYSRFDDYIITEKLIMVYFVGSMLCSFC